jgi:hypothetical protein
MILGVIPLSPEPPEFDRQHYWRLPINNEVVLAMLNERFFNLAPECEEVDFL